MSIFPDYSLPVGSWPYGISIPPQGWICPKCGRVYNPDCSQCLNCNNSEDSKAVGGAYE